jgi:hypothetical protein
MNLRCLAYKIYDWAKTTPIAAPLYGFDRYRHLGPITVEGVVQDCVHGPSADGDRVFDIMVAPDDLRHCEITPCASPELEAVASKLMRGQRYRVSGIQTYDPPHVGSTSPADEIHPVSGVEGPL